MLWYLDITAIILTVIICQLYFRNLKMNALSQKVTTKDGYDIEIEQLARLHEESHALFSVPLAYLYMVLDSNRFKWNFILNLTVVTLVLYGTVGNVLDFYFSIPNQIAPILGVHIFYWMLCSRFKKDVQRVVDDSKELLIETPGAYKQYGQYFSNPYPARSMLENLLEYEEKWKECVANMDGYLEATNLYGGFDEKKWIEHNQFVRRSNFLVEDQIELMLANNLFTNTSPLLTQPVATEKIIPKGVFVNNEMPAHMQEMQTISLDTSLPKEVTGQAKELLDSFKALEKEQSKQQAIDKAMIAIHTVRKYYDEDNRI